MRKDNDRFFNFWPYHGYVSLSRSALKKHDNQEMTARLEKDAIPDEDVPDEVKEKLEGILNKDKNAYKEELIVLGFFNI